MIMRVAGVLIKCGRLIAAELDHTRPRGPRRRKHLRCLGCSNTRDGVSRFVCSLCSGRITVFQGVDTVPEIGHILLYAIYVFVEHSHPTFVDRRSAHIAEG
jgi:hypothetical protein